MMMGLWMFSGGRVMGPATTPWHFSRHGLRWVALTLGGLVFLVFIAATAIVAYTLFSGHEMLTGQSRGRELNGLRLESR